MWRGPGHLARNPGRAATSRPADTYHRILRQDGTAHLPEAVDPTTEICRLDGYQHAHLRSDLDHGRSRNTWITLSSAALESFNRTVSRVPSADIVSTITSPAPTPLKDANPATSIKPG
jgi:hypothetical protein